MLPNIGDGRPLRGCSVCDVEDDHPRHVLSRTVSARGGPGPIRHIDCCRRVGCPDGSCDKAPEDLRGADLLGYQLATRE